MKLQRRLKASIPVLILIGVLPCSCREDPFRHPVEHPLPDSVSAPPSRRVRVSVESEPDGQATELADRFVKALQGRRVIARIPVQPAPPRLTVARLWSASVLGDERTAMLHSGLLSVAVYDSTGSILQVLDGSTMEGVSFSGPMGLLTSGPDTAWVIDQRSGLVPLVASSHELLTVGKPVPVQGPFRDACVVDGYLFVHATGELEVEDILRRYEFPRADHPPRLMAQPYRSSGVLAGSKVLQGRLACLNPDLVVVAFDNVPWIEAYGTRDGVLRWHTEMADLRPPRILEAISGERVQLRDSEGPFTHFLARVVGGVDGSIVVQYARLDNSLARKDRGREYVVQSYLLDARTGQGAYLGEDVPEILFVNASHIVLLHRAPDPHIEIARLPDRITEIAGR